MAEAVPASSFRPWWWRRPYRPHPFCRILLGYRSKAPPWSSQIVMLSYILSRFYIGLQKQLKYSWKCTYSTFILHFCLNWRLFKKIPNVNQQCCQAIAAGSGGIKNGRLALNIKTKDRGQKGPQKSPGTLPLLNSVNLRLTCWGPPCSGDGWWRRWWGSNSWPTWLQGRVCLVKCAFQVFFIFFIYIF